MRLSGERAELGYYEFLSRLDVSSPETRTAITFTRIFSDLAQRVVAARATQNQVPVEYALGLKLHLLRAYLDGGANGLGVRLADSAPDDWDPVALRLLAPLSEWLAAHFDPAEPASTSVQVWVGQPGQQRIRLFGRASITPRGDIEPLPTLFELLPEIPLQTYLQDCGNEAIGILSHYDVHGLSMMALSLRYLHGLGRGEPQCEMSFEWTGDIGKLWKRAVPKCLAEERGLSAVVMVDCPVHSRKPEHTLRAIGKLEANPAVRLLMIDHHPDTFLLAPQMQHERLQLVLTDVFSCGLTRTWDRVETQIMALGALSDKVPEIDSAYPESENPTLHEAVTNFHRWHLHFSPTPKVLKDSGIHPLRPLWEALAGGAEASADLAAATLGTLPPEEPVTAQGVQVCGGVLLITDRLQAVGRAWYALLEELMAAHDVPYALALRLLDRRRANFLLLTRWQATHVPPGRFFVPERYAPHLLGHPGALWADLDKAQAPVFIREVLEGINSYLGTPGIMQSALEAIQKNILDAEPVQAESETPPPGMTEDAEEL